MCDMFYLLSQDIGNGPYYIGDLHYNAETDSYAFEYKIKGDTFPEPFMMIPGLEEVNGQYSSEQVYRHIMLRVVPDKEDAVLAHFLKDYQQDIYNPWRLLLAMIDRYKQQEPDARVPYCDSHRMLYFYEELPERVNRYDQ